MDGVSMRNNVEETILFGVNTISVLLEHAPDRIKRIMHIAKGKGGAREQLIQHATSLGIDVTSVKERQINHYLPDTQHQGIMAFVTPRPLLVWRDLLNEEKHPLLMAADQVTDPRNFGAILRSAEAFGVHGVLITSNRCARPGPTVARTSAGASELIPIAMETNLSASLGAAQKQGYQVIGASMNGIPLSQVDWNRPTVVVIGAEGKGLREKTISHCDQIVSIPMKGRTESLNASVAASLIFYEATRKDHALQI
jgi:23S rRNA (guanosine2251-2'-O)-methyltransferase